MRRALFLILTLFTFMTISSMSKKDEKVIVEEVVAVVGGSTISLSDLYQTTEQVVEDRKQHGISSKLEPAEEAFEYLLRQRLLIAQARVDSLDAELRPVDDEVEMRIAGLVKEAGSMKALEQMAGKAIFQIRDDLKQEIIDINLAQQMEYILRSKVGITHKEVEEYFNTIDIDSLPIMPPQVAYAQIVKTPPTTEERKYEVRQRLLEFRERILKGERMEVLARLYSQDGSKTNGGEFSSPFGQTVAPFADAVRQLTTPGQVSEIVETEYGFHIIELISKTDQDFTIRHILLKPEFTFEEEVQATRELDSLAKEIKEGKMTFAYAARRHSDDAGTRMNGGQNFNTSMFRGDMREVTTKYVYDQLHPNDSRVLNKLEIGDVSQPYQSIDEKGNIVFKIVTVTERIPSHKVNLQQDFTSIEDLALNDKTDKYMEEWIKKAILKTYVRINPAYLHYELSNPVWFEQSQKTLNREESSEKLSIQNK